MFDETLNDPSVLRRLSGFLQWAAIALVFCGGCLQVLRLIVDQREKEISGQIAAERDRQQQEREAALRNDLQSSNRNLAELATRAVFRPLAPAARAQLVTSLRAFQDAHEVALRIRIYTESGSRSRAAFTTELSEILSESGLAVEENGTGTTFSRGALPAISLQLSDASLPLVDAFVGVLRSFVTTDWSAQRVDLPLGELVIHVYGDPQFDAEGKVSFQ